MKEYPITINVPSRDRLFELLSSMVDPEVTVTIKGIKALAMPWVRVEARRKDIGTVNHVYIHAGWIGWDDLVETLEHYQDRFNITFREYRCTK